MMRKWQIKLIKILKVTQIKYYFILIKRNYEEKEDSEFFK